jgi:hypothetical protein
MKTSIIKSIKETGTWQPPSGELLHYHEIHFDNGDNGSAGLKKSDLGKYNVGDSVEYDFNPNGKLKIIGKAGSQSTQPQQQYEKKPPFVPYTKEIDYLGFAASYSKDLVIAGKTTKKDIEDFKKILAEIYPYIQDMVKNSKANETK